MEELLAEEERERVRQRQQEKLKRRELRFLRYLDSERDFMLLEDDRSYKLRHFCWESTQIAREM